MIIDLRRGNVLEAPRSEVKRIAFAVNAEGTNDGGFCAEVTQQLWPALRYLPTGMKLGTVSVNKVSDNLTLYACCVHSLSKEGWTDAPLHIKTCFDEITEMLAQETLDEEPVDSVLMGSGMIGQMQGANPFANLGAMARSPLYVRGWTL